MMLTTFSVTPSSGRQVLSPLTNMMTCSTGCSNQDKSLLQLILSFCGSLVVPDVHLKSLYSTRMVPSNLNPPVIRSSPTLTLGMRSVTCSLLISQLALVSQRVVSLVMFAQKMKLLRIWQSSLRDSLKKTQNFLDATSISLVNLTPATTSPLSLTIFYLLPPMFLLTSRVSQSEMVSLIPLHSTQPTPLSPTRMILLARKFSTVWKRVSKPAKLSSTRSNTKVTTAPRSKLLLLSSAHLSLSSLLLVTPSTPDSMSTTSVSLVMPHHSATTLATLMSSLTVLMCKRLLV